MSPLLTPKIRMGRLECDRSMNNPLIKLVVILVPLLMEQKLRDQL
jgi:hypothetical protein